MAFDSPVKVSQEVTTLKLFIKTINFRFKKTVGAAAKSLQSYPTLCDPIDGSPPGFPIPGILQARTLEWVAISFSSGYRAGTVNPPWLHSQYQQGALYLVRDM